MSRTTKILIQPRTFALSLILFGIVICAYAVGKMQGKEKASVRAQAHLGQVQSQLLARATEKQLLEQQLAVANQQKILQEQTLLNLREYIESLQGENATLAQSADIYQALIQNDKKQEHLKVRQFALYDTPKSNRVRYSLVLSKEGVSEISVSGSVDMALHGSVNNKLVSLPVKHFNLPEHQGLQYQFQHFQELSGELDIPAEFTPTHVSVRVHRNGVSAPIIQEWYDWGLQSRTQNG